MSTGKEMDLAPPSKRMRGYMLIMLTLTYAISFVDRTIINVLVQPIKVDLKLSDAEIGLVSGAAFGVLYAIMGVPLARIADRYSRLNLIAVAMSFWSMATAACGFATGFWSLFAARVGVGIGEAAGSPAAQSIISDLYPPERRPAAMSVYALGVPVGILFGAVFGGWIAQEFGWRMAFILVGIPGIATAVLAKLTLREPMRGIWEGPTAPRETVSLRQAASTLMSLPAFRWICSGFTFAAIAGYSLTLFMVSYIQRRTEISLLDASFAYGLASGITGIAGMTIGGMLTVRLGKRDRRMQCWVPAIGLALAAPLFVLGLLVVDPVMMAICLILGATVYPMYVGPGYAAAHNLVDPRMRATATAVLLLVSTLLGTGLGPPLTGWISDLVARASFEGNFDALCQGVTASLSCKAASSRGLQMGMVAAALAYVGAAFSFYMAGRRMGGN